MSRRLIAAVVAFLFTGVLCAPPAFAAKPKRPSLGVRVSPRMGFSPISVLAMAELSGGEDVEEFYCLGIEWNWDDGSKSLQDSDCDPYQPGMKIERRFSAEHYYSRAGSYNIRATLLTQDKVVATNAFRLVVRQGIPTGDDAAEALR